MYQPHCEVSVDEAMIKFQGRSSLKKYMPLKSVKCGINVWVLADSHNGYFKKFEVNSGNKGDSTEKGLGTKVVKSLTSELHKKHHQVFIDIYKREAAGRPAAFMHVAQPEKTAKVSQKC